MFSKIRQFFYCYIIHYSKQIWKPKENFSVEFTCKFEELLVYLIKSWMNRLFKFSNLRYKKWPEAFHRWKTWNLISLMTSKRAFNKFIVIITWAFIIRFGKLAENISEFTLNDSTFSDLLSLIFTVSNISTWQSIFIVVSKLSN